MPDAGTPQTREERDTYLREALPVDVACLVGEPASTLFNAYLWVEPRLQPGLALLAPGRLYRSADGITFVWTYVDEDGPDAKFLLDVQSQAPVRIAFHLLFSLPGMLTVLEGIAQFGRVSILPGPAPGPEAQQGKQRRKHSALFEAIEEQGGQAMVFLLPSPVMRDLGEHLEQWKAQYLHLPSVSQRAATADGLARGGT